MFSLHENIKRDNMKKKEIKRETAILLLLIISFITIPMNHIQADNAPEFQGTSCTNFSARFGEVVFLEIVKMLQGIILCLRVRKVAMSLFILILLQGMDVFF